MQAAVESEDLGSIPLLEQVQLEIGPFSSPFVNERKTDIKKKNAQRVEFTISSV